MNTNLTISLLPNENLVIERAPGWARVDFISQEVPNAVQVRANLFKNNQTVKATTGYGKALQCFPFKYVNGFIKFSSSNTDT